MIFLNKKASIPVIIVSTLILILSIVGIIKPNTATKQTTGTIVDIVSDYNFDLEDTKYTAYIEYSARGHKYTHVEFPAYNSSMNVGDKVTVLYDPDNPEHIEAEGSEKVPYITGAVSLVILAVGIVSFIKKN